MTDRYRPLTAAAVLWVAAIATVVSYMHAATLALHYGQPPLAAYLLPLSIDGLVASSSLVMLRAARARCPITCEFTRPGRTPALRGAGFSSGAAPWWGLHSSCSPAHRRGCGWGWPRWRFPLLARAGRPAGKPIVTAATLPATVQAPDQDVITRALGSLGIAGIGKWLRDGRPLVFPSPVREDRPGRRAEVDLPFGVTAAMVVGLRLWHRHTGAEPPEPQQAQWLVHRTVPEPREVASEPPPPALEQHIHHHWHTARPEDVAVIIDRSRRQDGQA